MSLSFNNVGFNLSETKIQVVEIVNSGDQFFAENIDEEHFSEVLDFRAKEGKIIDILQASLNELLLRNKFKSSNVSVALPPKLFKVFQIPLEKRLAQQDVKKYLKWEFERLFPAYSSENFSIKFFTIKEEPEKNSKHISVFAVSRNILLALNKFFARNNFVLRHVDHAHIATLNILRASHTSNSQTVLNAYLGENSISLLFTKENFPLLARAFEFDSVSEIPEILKSIFDSLETFGLNKYDFLDGFISGEFVSESLLKQLKEELDVTLKKLNPFSTLNVAEHLKASSFFNEKYNSLTAACGIALRLD